MAGMALAILHVDLDQFLASVEQRRRPELRGRPVVVGGNGDPTRPRQVVMCASYEARAYGLRAGMPLVQAVRRCPDAVFLPNDAPAYQAASDEVMTMLRGFPVDVEVLGWDEAFLGARSVDPVGLAKGIRRGVLDVTGLPCSIGVGDTKEQAKAAVAFAKPGGVHRLTTRTWPMVMGERPVGVLWGVGPRTVAALAGLGLRTVAELAAAPRDLLVARFGPTTGQWLHDLAHHGGNGTTLVTTPRPPKSTSRQRTFDRDLGSHDEIRTELVTLAREIAGEALRAGHELVRVGVTVRTVSFWTRTRSAVLRPVRSRPAGPLPPISVADVERVALAVLDRFEITRPVRLLGVRVDFAENG